MTTPTGAWWGLRSRKKASIGACWRCWPVHQLGTRLLEGSGLHVSATTERLRALDGADYVLTTFHEGA